MPGYGGPPVAVVGAGPVGQTAALLLAHWGIPSVLLDRRPERDVVGSKSICQQRDVLDIWDTVGAGGRIAAEGVTWSRARTYYRDAELFCLELPASGSSPFPPFVNLSQSRTEQILDELIAAEPLVDLRWAHDVAALTEVPGGVHLSCRTPGGDVDLTAPYVLACAGGKADELRAGLGIRLDGQSFADQFLICDIRAELPESEHERRFYFDPAWNPGRQVLIHPCPGSTYRIDWQVPADYDLAAEESSGALDARIRRIVGNRPYEIVWRSVYRFHERVADRMRVGRVLLAGDCAHLYAPFGARGLNSGVQDAENAAWKLAFVLHGWAPESLLASYHDERHAAARENLAITNATMRFLVPQSASEHAHRRDVLDRAVHDPGARAQVDSGRLSEPFWYVDSPLTTPHPERPFPGRPAKGALPPVVPGVLTPDVLLRPPDRPGVTRLHQLTRSGLLVLNTGRPDDVTAALTSATTAPVHVPDLADIPGADAVDTALGLRPGELALIRPDGHLAAVVDTPAELRAAVRRVLGARG